MHALRVMQNFRIFVESIKNNYYKFKTEVEYNNIKNTILSLRLVCINVRYLKCSVEIVCALPNTVIYFRCVHYSFTRCVRKIALYSDLIHSFDWKSAVEHDGGV